MKQFIITEVSRYIVAAETIEEAKAKFNEKTSSNEIEYMDGTTSYEEA
jgi:hypothetical protein